MISSVDYHKVISYNKNQAEVLYVSKSSKDIMSFKIDQNKNIQLESWKTIWSSTGSADRFDWFFYR